MPDNLGAIADTIRTSLDATNKAREEGLTACRRVIRSAGLSIRAIHRHESMEALRFRSEASEALHEAQSAVAKFPQIAYSGPLADAEKEYAEAVLASTLVEGGDLPDPQAVGVRPTAWLHGLAEAASELRRYLLDELRNGELDNSESLLQTMSDVVDTLMTFDYPDAVTSGLRRTTDALRAVAERTRGDVTTTLMQSRLQWAIENRKD